MKLNIAICGLTHLGLVYAAIFSKNFNCILYDKDRNHISNLSNNIFEIKEYNLKEQLIKNKKNITYTNNINDIKNTSLIFLTLDIKTNSKGDSSYYQLNKYILDIKKILDKKKTLIILSQLKPGFCRNLKKSISCELIYFVETLVFGRAIERAMHPERIIIGINQRISNNFQKFLKIFKCPIIKMSYESAELTKISINLFLVSSVITTNYISKISKKISANWSDIKKAIQLDKRIGKYSYLSPGLGISGGNLERDLISIKKLSENLKIKPYLIDTWIKESALQKLWISRILKKIGKKLNIKKVGLLGIAYKVGTNSIKNSPSILTIKGNKNYFFKCNDPLVEKKKYFKNMDFFTLKECLNGIDALIIAIPYKTYNSNFILKNINLKTKIIIDPFRVLDIKKKKKNFLYYYL
tara:strand:- start:43 stop:1275 length:1233 start_codon:yes stop_codon:yes gene_type:complete